MCRDKLHCSSVLLFVVIECSGEDLDGGGMLCAQCHFGVSETIC